MNDQPGNNSTPNHETSNIDLAALRHGPEVLDPRGIPQIQDIKLIALDVAPKSETQQLTTIQGSDILRSTSTHNTIPKRGILTRAAFILHLADSPKPFVFELQPPDTIKTSAAHEARLVRSWLEKSPFIAHAHALAVIPLCLALATAPAFGDGDYDEDDIDTDRSGLACAPVGYCRLSIGYSPFQHVSVSAFQHFRSGLVVRGPVVPLPRSPLRLRRWKLKVGSSMFAFFPSPPIRVHPCSSVVILHWRAFSVPPRIRRRASVPACRLRISRITHHVSLIRPFPLRSLRSLRLNPSPLRGLRVSAVNLPPPSPPNSPTHSSLSASQLFSVSAFAL